MKRLAMPRLKDPIRPRGRCNDGLEARWERDGEGSPDHDGRSTEDYEDSTIANLRPSEFGSTVFSDESIERCRDLIVFKLERARIPVRVIAKILNTSPATVTRRSQGISQEARRYYAKCDLGSLCSS